MSSSDMLSSVDTGGGSGFFSGVLGAIHRHSIISAGDRLVVAISGGPDSVALLLALVELRDFLKLKITAAHVNHQLRGEDAQQDEEFVQRFCQSQGVPLRVEWVNTAQVAHETGENLEDCARRVRYEFLFRVALELEAAVATGHTLNDQAETFLMKLVRGSGPTGLSGIHPMRQNQVSTVGGNVVVTVLRPLLEVSHAQILDYLSEKKQSYRQDQSNFDLGLDRNWVRHSLIPLLQERLNPALLSTLKRAAGLFREIEEFLLQSGVEAYEHCRVVGETTGFYIEALHKFPKIIQREVIRLVIRSAKGDLRDIGLKHVDEVLKLTRACSGREIHLPGELRARHEFGILRLDVGFSPAPFSYLLKVPGQVQVEEVGKSVIVRRSTESRQEAGTLRIQWSGDSLTIRSRKPGDRYCISTKSRVKKLKKLFQSQRIPKSQRDRVIIVEADGEIVWVEGFPPHPNYRAQGSVSPTLEIEVHDETLLSETASKDLRNKIKQQE